MKFRTLIAITFSLGLFLAACGSATLAAPSATGVVSQAPQEETSASELTRTDNQGAVVVKVSPLNPEDPGEMLNFDVVLDTHSVDLSMDLATLAILMTDTGQSVQATLWDAPRGGHHVEGTLSFPASTEAKQFLEGAKTLTLTIKDLDAPERSFSWSLSE